MLECRNMATPLEEFLGMDRKIALKIAPSLAAVPLTPNQVTSMALAAGVGAAACFSQGTRQGLLLGAFFMQVYFILDNCDGAVARLRNMSSVMGMWYDFIADLVVDYALWAGFTVAVLSRGTIAAAAWIGALAAFGSTLHFFRTVRGRLGGRTGKEPAPDPSNHFLVVLHSFSNDGSPTLLVWLLALFATPEVFLVGGCVYINFIGVAGIVSDAMEKPAKAAGRE